MSHASREAASLNPLTCVHCPDLCAFACPAVAGSGAKTASPMGKVSTRHWVERGVQRRSPATDLLPFLCTDCGLCTEVCEHDQPVAAYLYAAREELARLHRTPDRARGMLPDEEALRATLREAAERLESPGPGACEMLLFCGCSLLERGADSVVRVVRLFERLGLGEVGLDPDGPICCGAPWRDLGDVAGWSARALGWHQEESRAAEAVVMADPRCERSIAAADPRAAGADTSPRRISMWRALAGSFHGRLRQRLDLRVALLGSCHVARHRHHRGATESLLESILESPVIRLGFRDRWSRCCGHAGGMASTFEDVALEASRTLLREAQLLGADAILSETPGCTDHLRRAREADETLPEPLGLVDLIERALA